MVWDWRKKRMRKNEWNGKNKQQLLFKQEMQMQ